MKKLFLWTFVLTLLCTWAVVGADQAPKVPIISSQVPDLDREAIKAEKDRAVPKLEKEEGFAEPQGIYGAEATQVIEEPYKPDYTGPINVPDQNVILQGGDVCAQATVIPSIPYNTDGATAGYTDDYEESCFYSPSTSPDVVYAYTPEVDIAVNISLCQGQTDYDTKVYVYEDVCQVPDDGQDPYACNDDFCSSPYLWVSYLECVQMNVGHTYYIVVDGYGGGSGNYNIDITECVPPTGACCVEEVCVFTSEEQPCLDAGGDWYEGESCPDFGCPMIPVETCADASVWDNSVADGVNGARPTLNWDPNGMIDDFQFGADATFNCVRVEIVEGTTPMGVPSDIMSARIRIYNAPNGMGSLDWPTDGPNPLYDITYQKADGSMMEIDSGQDLFSRDLVYFDLCGEAMSLGPGNYGMFLTFPGRGPDDFFWASATNAHGNETNYIWGPDVNPPSPNSFFPETAFHLGIGTCEDLYGACCDDETGFCENDVLSSDCPAPLRFAANTLCVDLIPPCGVLPTGACCDEGETGDCVDDLTVEECTALGYARWEQDVLCVDLEPPCEGAPPTGACCDDETGYCEDGVWDHDCPPPLRFAANTLCEDLDPPCVPLPTELNFFQLDFILDDDTTYNSDWGYVDMTFTGAEPILYFNLTADGTWQVRNIAVLSIEGVGVEQTMTYSFAIAEVSGIDVTQLTYGYQLTHTVLTTMPDEAHQDTVYSRWIVFSGGGEGGGAAPLREAAPLQGGPVADPQKHTQDCLPNQDCGIGECIPAAVSNSVQYLNDEHELGIPAEKITIEKMKVATGWIDSDNGCPAGWNIVKDAYMKDNNIPVATYIPRPLTDVFDLLQAKQDVEIGSKKADGRGHHWARVVGIADEGNGKYSIDIIHDRAQGVPHDPNADPPDCSLEPETITYDTPSGKFEGSPGLFDGLHFGWVLVECNAQEPKEGRNMHPEDPRYRPSENPTGTNWDELHPTDGNYWEFVDWEDNGNNKLDSCDNIVAHATSGPDYCTTDTFHVVDVLPAIKVEKIGPGTIHFLAYLGINPDIDPIEILYSTYWQEVHPNYDTRYICEGWEDNGNAYLDSCDYIYLHTISGPDSCSIDTFHVKHVATHIVVSEVSHCEYYPGDVNCNGIPAELSDVITMIGMYRGTVPHCYECDCPPHGEFFAPSADPNGNCVSDELPDVVAMIGIYRGTVQAASCVDCPGQGLLAPGRDGTLVVPPLKPKVKVNKGNMEE